MRGLQEENGRLRQWMADPDPDKQMLRDVLRKALEPACLPEDVEVLQMVYSAIRRRVYVRLL